MLTKAELEFYESARHSLASISKSLESIESSIIKESGHQICVLQVLYHKLIHEKNEYDSWIRTGAMEEGDQAFRIGRIRILEELIKEIEDGKE